MTTLKKPHLLLIGKPILGNLGFCQVSKKMREEYYTQLRKIQEQLPASKKIITTSMTNLEKIEATNGKYLPQLVVYNPEYHTLFDPYDIYQNCIDGMDSYRPSVDFIIENNGNNKVALTTFSREAPILSFASTKGDMALGCITRQSLMVYGDFLFEQMKKALRGYIQVILFSTNHYEYPEGTIESMVRKLADKHVIVFGPTLSIVGEEKCYHRGEEGNHVVAMWND